MEFNEWIDTYVNDDVTKEALAKWNQQIEENKQIKIAHEQGLKEGLEKGIEKGLKKGIEQGIEQGFEKGLEQKGIQIVQKMLKKNMALEEIAEITGLTKENIEKLKENA